MLESYLKPYDMIFTWYSNKNIFRKIITSIIRFFTRGGPEHVRLYMGNRKFTEFTYPESRWGDLLEIDMENTKVEIGRNRLMSDIAPEEEVKLLNWCNKYIGVPYDIEELIWEHILDEIGIDSTDESRKNRFVCSTYVKNAYKEVGRDMTPSEALSSPQDLRNSKHYMAIFVHKSTPFNKPRSYNRKGIFQKLIDIIF